jgi:tRNA threonylcarbamoyladenosine biosynthesis protein TsaB
MRFAAIETSGEWCSVALWLDGDVVCAEQRAGVRHGEFALPMLQSLMQRHGVSRRALQAVAFGAGPGAFTGLRMACGLAQGIALGLDIPVLPISTLAALAEESGATRVLTALDARMQEVYFAAFEQQGDQWRESIAAQCVPPSAVSLPAGTGWVGAGNGFAAYGEALAARLGAQMQHCNALLHPSAAAIARLAAPRLAAGEVIDAALAVPVYVRNKVALTRTEQAGLHA